MLYHINKYNDHDIISIDPAKYWFSAIRKPHRGDRNDVHGYSYRLLIAALTKMNKRGILKDTINLDLVLKTHNHIYCNYFVAKTDVYRDFVETYLNPTIDFLTHDPEFKVTSQSDSGYPHQPPPHFIQKTGFDYYPMRPFMLERLINVYCLIRGITPMAVL